MRRLRNHMQGLFQTSSNGTRGIIKMRNFVEWGDAANINDPKMINAIWNVMNYQDTKEIIRDLLQLTATVKITYMA